jgi:5'-3' exonuclease
VPWTIHFRHNGAIGYRSARSREIALEQARELSEQGADVRQITSSAGHKSMEAEEIKRACAARETSTTEAQPKKE